MLKKIITIGSIMIAGCSIVVNQFLFIGIVLGVLFRSYSGSIISLTTGLAIGILINELMRFVMR